MWIHLERLLSRESGARDAERPDELRRYRVATRRLRAALRMFASAYPAKEVRPLRQALSDLAETVGAVRDLDLRIADLNRWAIERGADSATAVAPMLAAWARDRERAVAGPRAPPAIRSAIDVPGDLARVRRRDAQARARGPSPAPTRSRTVWPRASGRPTRTCGSFAPALAGRLSTRSIASASRPSGSGQSRVSRRRPGPDRAALTNACRAPGSSRGAERRDGRRGGVRSFLVAPRRSPSRKLGVIGAYLTPRNGRSPTSSNHRPAMAAGRRDQLRPAARQPRRRAGRRA